MNPPCPSKRIFISTAEASGELLASTMLLELKKIKPQLEVLAMGGSELQAAGAKIVIDSSDLAIMGFWEVVTHIKTIWRTLKKIELLLKTERPDLLILVDYPGFNLKLAKIALHLKIPVFYYVSPQIWAWRYGRIKKIRERVQHMAVLFPFEEDLYRKENVPVSFVGHPLLALNKTLKTRQEIYQQWNLKAEHPIVALFPGSRVSEIKRLLPVILQTVKLIRQKIPTAQFVLAAAKSLNEKYLQSFIDQADLAPHSILMVAGANAEIFSIATAAIATSGTVTLEIAYNQVPQVIIYKGSWFNAIVAKLMLRINNIGLCNIVANDLIAKEYLQHRARPRLIANETIELIQNHHYRQGILEKLRILKEKLATDNASQKVAQAVLNQFAVKDSD